MLLWGRTSESTSSPIHSAISHSLGANEPKYSSDIQPRISAVVCLLSFCCLQEICCQALQFAAEGCGETVNVKLTYVNSDSPIHTIIFKTAQVPTRVAVVPATQDSRAKTSKLYVGLSLIHCWRHCCQNIDSNFLTVIEMTKNYTRQIWGHYICCLV